MAQLPPKIPTMTQNWPSFPFQMIPSFPSSTSTAATVAAAAALPQQNSWVDEFLDFSSTRRNNHRRSVSDPIAFVETPSFVEECSRTSNGGGAVAITCNNNNNGFEKLDDEQLRTMFSDDVPAIMGLPPTLSSSNPCSTNPSTPSNQNNSENDDKIAATDQNLYPKTEPGEEDSSCEPPRIQMQPSTNVSSDAIVDPKRIKRILANRQSAQRSRVRKLQYISELERSVTTLQTEVSALSPRVAFLDHQRLILTVDNSALKQRIAALAQDKIFKDAHQEALRKEIERLRQIYDEQNMNNKMGNKEGITTNEAVSSTPFSSNFNKNNATDQE